MPPAPTAPPTVTAGTADPDFSVSVAPPPALLQRGANVTLTAIVASLGGFNGPVTLSVQGDLPQWLVVSFAPATVTPLQPKPSWSGTISSAVYIDTSTVPDFYTRTMVPGRTRTAVAGLPLLGLVLLPLVWRRRRWAVPLCAGVLLCGLPLVQGCGAGIYPNQVAAGTYQLNVLATASSGQTHVVPLLIRVAP